MFDNFLARFVYQCNPNNMPLIRPVHENDDIYLMAFPAYKDDKKTLLPLDVVIDSIEKTGINHPHDPAMLRLLDISQWNIGLMPCKTTMWENYYVIISPGGARYINGYVSDPDIRPLLHDYNDLGLYTWVITQKDENNETCYYPAYELESVMYRVMRSKAAFTLFLPLLVKGIKNLFKLNDAQCREFLDVYCSLHERACKDNHTQH